MIDFSPHTAPAPFADAVIVADAMAWEGAPRRLGERFACEHADGGQLLARAVAFRTVVVEILSGADGGRVQAEIDAYRPAGEIAVAHSA